MMKKNIITFAAVILMLAVIAAFAACSGTEGDATTQPSGDATSAVGTTRYEAVTDADGIAVTDADGNAVTVVVTDKPVSGIVVASGDVDDGWY